MKLRRSLCSPVSGGTCGWDRLVLIVGVGSKCFLIPELLAWTLVWVGDVGCWRGILKLRRGDSHPCEILRCNQWSD